MEPTTPEINKDTIITYYMDAFLENAEKPKSIYQLAKQHHFSEADFYKLYGSLEAVEKDIFKKFLENTVALLKHDDNYLAYDAKNKMLSFYYTFFENLAANRSYVLLTLKSDVNPLKNLAQLSTLRLAFKEFVNEVLAENTSDKDNKFQRFQHQAIQESAWLQLMLTLQYWLKDESAAFEKTDIFIEKSVNASFELMDAGAFKHVIDFGKFLFKENLQAK